jgi:putative phage-type endonuclease
MTLVIQNTPEWFHLRLGQVTSSRVADIVARTKSGYSTSRANYLAQLLSERLTAVPIEGFTSGPMQWGIDHEAEARAAYEFRFDRSVRLADFVPHPTIAMSGASPDGFIGENGLVEIKCPNTSTHLDTLIGGAIPVKYEIQMLWQMACTGRKWSDFVSFDPRLPESMALFVKRFERDETRIAELEEEVRSFLWELDRMIASLDKRYGTRAAF